jgi:hypothetical protein
VLGFGAQPTDSLRGPVPHVGRRRRLDSSHTYMAHCQLAARGHEGGGT